MEFTLYAIMYMLFLNTAILVTMKFNHIIEKVKHNKQTKVAQIGLCKYLAIKLKEKKINKQIAK